MVTKKEKSSNSNNSSNIQLFYYEGLSVRTLNIDGEIWFVAKDVADILGYSDATHATRYLDDDEKALFNTNENTLLNWEFNQEAGISTLDWSSIQGDEENQTSKRGNPNIIIITEPGLYELVFRSNKPDAKAFSRWVRHDVLPSIRKNGRFSLNTQNHQRDTVRELIDQQKTVNERLAFWKSLLEASHSLFTILLATSRDWPRVYVVPEAVKNNDVDRNEVNLLRCMANDIKEFLSNKIVFLERKYETIKEFFED